VRIGNKMSSNLSGNANEMKCEYCGLDKTYMAVTKIGTPNQNGITSRTLLQEGRSR
jgi:hypothetical protein